MSSAVTRLFQFVLIILVAGFLFGQAADDWLKKGQDAMKQSRYAEAQSAFENAVQADPTRVVAHLQLATAVLGQLHPGPRSSAANQALVQTAEREFRRALDLDAMNWDGIVGLAALQYQLGIEAADPAQRTARLDDAAHLYERIAATPSRNHKAILMALGAVDGARPLTELAKARTGMKAGDAGPLRDASLRRALQERYGSVIAQGIANVTAALEIDSADVQAMILMGLLLRERALLRDGEAESAADVQLANEWQGKSRLAATAAAAKFSPPSVPVPSMPPMTPNQTPASERLVADLTEAIQRKPDFGSAYFARGNTYLMLHQYANAVQDFTEAIKLKPADAVIAYSNRAQAYAAMNQREEEIADLTELLRLKPEDGWAHLRRATSYRLTGHCDKAIGDYTEVIRLNGFAVAYSARATCRRQLGELEGAAADQKIFDELAAKQNAAAKPPIRPGAIEPTIIAPPDIRLPNYGDPLGKPAPPSNGPGSGGGIGSGNGGGIGQGAGGGTGSGAGGPMGSGVYRAGGAVSQPLLLWKTEPEYSEEARQAKYQGTVTLSLVVDEDGGVRDVKVVRGLGLGLDQKAIEAVGRWVFKPGLKDGKPVPVSATIQVSFRLL